MKTMKLVEHGSLKVLAEIAATPKALNGWCDANGYLPHHKISGGWVVIK